jgi:hypothetical protein
MHGTYAADLKATENFIEIFWLNLRDYIKEATG